MQSSPGHTSKLLVNRPRVSKPCWRCGCEDFGGFVCSSIAALEESKKVTYIKRDMSLAEAVANLRLTLVKQRTVRFSELLVNNDRVFIVYTFLAVLELIRLREIYAVQERLFGDIQLVRR